MAIPYAEVIGDPIDHSKSPLIHGFWLEKLGLPGEYRKRQVLLRNLPKYLEERRRDTFWRGCNVTAPLKEHAAAFVGAPPAVCGFVGAVNCITRTPLTCLIGTNTDVAGIAEAVKNVAIKNAKVCLIGAGGAARAALCHLLQEQAGVITIIVRNPAKAEPLRRLGPQVRIATFNEAAVPLGEASLLINASPLGMAGAADMPSSVLDSVTGTVFDMVYAPVETVLLKRARKEGAQAIDGLTMLIGQAAPAFELFFGAPAPREYDAELRRLLEG
ncbi:MAG TPA: shikimate dehydrogenase [Allosphingosinicella sp.]|uniref:shikimate dehydrogenase family protein n=1 Tax=Allosphingosinicella sp. TaxID=2823234 RepID=UPI002ED8D798